jgi:hypothetical protein
METLKITFGGVMGNRQEVVVTDIKMSFTSMVIFMIKWVLASIPAIIILSLLFGLLTVLFGGFIGGFVGGIRHI